jgi:UDP-GlcNAc:undecaprenyl-phosphate/decaprenyl-phosphate GlcNAc-1-phosphate transferase
MIAFAPIMLSFLVSVAMLAALCPLASRLGLVDHPSERRKSHAGSVPLIGGIAIFSAILASSLFVLPVDRTYLFGLSGGALLVILGALDDRFGLGPKVRLTAQVGAALLLSVGGGVTLTSLGDLLGFGPIGLGPFAVPLTVFAIVGIINAFNMIDGIDCLAGGLVLVALGALLILAPEIGPAQIMALTAIAALIPYLICNLGLLGYTGPKIFLGDAGSMLLGYIVVWALIDAVESQGSIAPVTALWLAAIPLIDTLSAMGRRLLKRTSPFTADRSHIHHLLTRILGSPREALILILSVAVTLATVGVLGQMYQVQSPIMFYAGIAVFAAYLIFLVFAQRLHRAALRRRRPILVEQVLAHDERV